VSYETGRATNVDPSAVSSRDDFADFLLAVSQDYEGTGQREWENGTLPRLLDGLAAVSSSRVVDQSDQESPTWRLFAELIVAATGYE
jgi:hypothetical protein